MSDLALLRQLIDEYNSFVPTHAELPTLPADVLKDRMCNVHLIACQVVELIVRAGVHRGEAIR